MKLNEGKLTFEFPSTWEVAKYDDWSYYRNQFQSVGGGAKAVDFVAIDDSKTLWLIEVKDYRTTTRTKPSDLGVEVAIKVRDSMAGLVAAACRANDVSEQDLAKRAVSANNIRVVLHLAQPARHSKLFPRPIDPTDQQIKLRQGVRAIDPHARVIEKTDLTGVPWTVS